MWDKYSPLFRPEEFSCKCGCGLNNMNPEHLNRLFKARQMAGIPFVITSGARCPEHNLSVGGGDQSDHLFGHGSDIWCMSSKSRLQIIHVLMLVGFNRIGVARNFIHAGSYPGNPRDVLWVY